MLSLFERELRDCGVKRGQQLALDDVLARLNVDLRERAAGLEVHVEVLAGRDGARASDRRLDDTVLRRDDLRRGPCGAGRGAYLGDSEDGKDDHRNRERVEIPGPALALAHDVASIVRSISWPCLSPTPGGPETLLSAGLAGSRRFGALDCD